MPLKDVLSCFFGLSISSMLQTLKIDCRRFKLILEKWALTSKILSKKPAYCSGNLWKYFKCYRL